MTDVDEAPAVPASTATSATGGVHDLRSAIELLRQHPGQYHETDHPVNPIAELAGVYKKIGAGGTVSRPTRLGPAMVFNEVQGYPGWRVLVGLMASRERVGLLLDCPPRELTQRMGHALANPIAPVDVGPEKAACQEVVHRADDPDFDLRTLLPARRTPDRRRPEQAFPFVTVDENGFPHAALLSRAEMEVGPGRADLRAVRSRRTVANLRRDGRAALIAIEGRTAHYLKLRLVRSVTAHELLACVFAVVEHKPDSLGIPLTPIGYRADAGIARAERWDLTAEGLRLLHNDAPATPEGT
jgi:hypothetical protein